MAWPYDAVTPIKQELLIGSTWTNITSDTRGSDKDVTIRRGYSSEQASLSSSSCTFTLRDTAGKYNNRNPTSTLYRKIGKNVRYRNSVGLGITSLRLTDTSVTSTGVYDGARARTADKAVLDITGDIDIRADAEADDWYGRKGHILAAKYIASTNQRSWVFATDAYGRLVLVWSTDGAVGTRRTAWSTASIPTTPGRLAMRATLDVDNGASGYTVTFYTSSTIAGTWTQLGAAVTAAGVTSVYSGTSELEVGSANNGGDRLGFTQGFNFDPFCGKFYAFELRNGINGTLVAKMDATAQAAGTTSWSDGLSTPNTWNLMASAEISAQDYRFTGAIPEMPTEWDETGKNVWTDVTAGDIIERLSSGQKALRSPIFRNLTQYKLDGYWPMEDDFGATSAGAYAGSSARLLAAAFGTATDLPGTAGALSFTDDTGFAAGEGNKILAAGSNVAFCLFYFKFANLPASSVNVISFYFTGGTTYRADISVSSTSYKLDLTAGDGTVLVTSNMGQGTGAAPTQWMAMRLKLTEVSGTITWEMAWYPVGAPVTYGSSGTYSGTISRAISWQSPGFAGKGDLQIAHVAMSRQDLEFTSLNFINSTNGYVGERAYARAFRLSAEENIPFWWVGLATFELQFTTAPMGAQGLKTYLDLMQEVATAEGGQLYSPRDKYGLAIRGYLGTINRAGPILDYTGKHLSGALKPREPQDIRNDVTVSGAGTTARWTRDSGPFNTSDPADDPEGAGLYDVLIPYSAGSSTQLLQIAQREVLIGTWDALRYSLVQVELHRGALLADPTLSSQIAALDLGQWFTITHLPLFGGGPDDAPLIVRGTTEILGNKSRTLQFNTAPAGPYVTGIYGTTTRRFGAAFTTLGSSVNTTAISLVFRSTDVHEKWSTTNLPYDIVVDGERMTVTAMGAQSGTGPYNQTGTVTRSVNGVVKSHSSGATMQIWMPARWAFDGRVS